MAIAGEARALGQGSAAVQAMMGAAKLQGLIVDKVQSDVLVRKPSASPESPDDMSPEQWLGEYTTTIEHMPTEKGSDLEPEPEGSGTVQE